MIAFAGDHAEIVPTYHCPKCSQQLDAIGLFDHDGEACPVFQCHTCKQNIQFFDAVVEVPFTFYVDDCGRPVYCPEDLLAKVGLC